MMAPLCLRAIYLKDQMTLKSRSPIPIYYESLPKGSKGIHGHGLSITTGCGAKMLRNSMMRMFENNIYNIVYIHIIYYIYISRIDRTCFPHPSSALDVVSAE